MSIGLITPHQIRTFVSQPIQISRHSLFCNPPKPLHLRLHTSPPKSQSVHQTRTQDDGIPVQDVKMIAKFRSRYNYIRVLEVSRKADHPFAGSRLLLLDGPGNIHSISFLFKSLTKTYFDVFATLPPIVTPGPIGILGFGAGTAARLILEFYPEAKVHGWELDPSVIKVAREFFGLEKLEKKYPDRLFVYIGDALQATVRDGFSAIFVDLFSQGSLLPELEDPNTWEKLKKCLRKGGRIMVNVGGSCVEAEDSRRDGKIVMEQTLKAMQKVFGEKLFVLNPGNIKDDSSIALTGELPDLEAWKKALPRPLKYYVHMWTPFSDYYILCSLKGDLITSLLYMMSSFQAKLATAVVVVYLFADASSASALLLNGDSKGLSLVINCRSSSRKAFPGKEGSSFGCERLVVISGKKKVPFRVLRSIPVRSPPRPVASRQSSMGSKAPPPHIIKYE
ncbi:hypothetical protein LWI28_012139 [Acer negundo]|uniref:Uncharacterized protein n=1 Tax=Acer negundo TaxID=4023 RepID=A0AAD5IVS3_ACENE|nr:hypothetical protein LWI28_012139 [Acer negundo]KAK4844463.1 hypothetical protein QYF36_020463 [Acer negundo]